MHHVRFQRKETVTPFSLVFFFTPLLSSCGRSTRAPTFKCLLLFEISHIIFVQINVVQMELKTQLNICRGTCSKVYIQIYTKNKARERSRARGSIHLENNRYVNNNYFSEGFS